MSDFAIDLQGVQKTYRGKVKALKNVDLQVRRGEVFGLLGPNGAGKSTLVKIMMTVIRPSRASGVILERPIGHKPTLRRIGYLPESHRFPRYLTGRQTLEFFGALSKVDRATRKRRAAELLETVGMTAWADRRVELYSKGMMQRVGLGQALIADPDLVVLDEPTDGVDPGGRRDIRVVIDELRRRGKTVFINSHLLSELELICDRLAILVGGAVARQGTMHELTLARQSYEIELGADAGAIAAVVPVRWQASTGAPALAPGRPPPLPGALPLRAGVLDNGLRVELERAILRIYTTDPAAVQPIIDLCRAANLNIHRVQLVRPSLEDLFIEAVGAHAPGAALA